MPFVTNFVQSATSKRPNEIFVAQKICHNIVGRYQPTLLCVTIKVLKALKILLATHKRASYTAIAYYKLYDCKIVHVRILLGGRNYLLVTLWALECNLDQL